MSLRVSMVVAALLGWALLAQACQSPSATPTLAPTTVSQQPNALRRKLHIEWGHGKWCWGAGICFVWIDTGPCGAEPVPTPSDRTVEVLARMEGHDMVLEFTTAPPERSTDFFVDDDIVFDACESLAVGYQDLTILSGEYPIDWESGAYGSVKLAIAGTPRDPVQLNVSWGRNKKHCTGNGICTLDEIGCPAALAKAGGDRQIQGTAWLLGNALVLDLASEPPERPRTLIIDEAFALDDCSTAAFDVDGITVVAGEYDIDYEASPFGRVVLQVELAPRGHVPTSTIRMTMRPPRLDLLSSPVAPTTTQTRAAPPSATGDAPATAEGAAPAATTAAPAGTTAAPAEATRPPVDPTRVPVDPSAEPVTVSPQPDVTRPAPEPTGIRPATGVPPSP